MQLTYDKKIIEKPLHSFYEKGTFELPTRLWEKNYTTSFKVLKNLVLVRTFGINSHKLTSYYIHLLEKEQFDEN